MLNSLKLNLESSFSAYSLICKTLSRGLLSAVVISPVVLVAAVPALAQTASSTESLSPESPNDSQLVQQNNLQTICRYNPDSGFPNAFGMRTYVTLTESEGNTMVMLERFPAVVAAPESVELEGGQDTEVVRADISEVRSLTFYDTPMAAARQLLLDQPYYYAALLDISESDLDEVGFEAVDKTLSCGRVVIEPAADTETAETDTADTDTSTENTSEADEVAEPPAKTPTATIADLPNGNYRFTSADFDNIVVSDEELAAAGGEVFLFRKFGDTVTGEMRFLDETGGVFCIGGKVEENTIIGSLASPSDGLRRSEFLDGDVAAEPSVDSSVEVALNLSNFSRINAGSQLPIEACSEGTYQ